MLTGARFHGQSKNALRGVMARAGTMKRRRRQDVSSDAKGEALKHLRALIRFAGYTLSGTVPGRSFPPPG